jgi:hypothetical protein
MRYVNLKKRNTSKFHFVTKRVASVSLVSLLFAAVVIVPLTTLDGGFDTLTKPEIVNVEYDNLGNDQIEVLNATLTEQEK